MSRTPVDRYPRSANKVSAASRTSESWFDVRAALRGRAGVTSLRRLAMPHTSNPLTKARFETVPAEQVEGYQERLFVLTLIVASPAELNVLRPARRVECRRPDVPRQATAIYALT
jgi:hypothetical protein